MASTTQMRKLQTTFLRGVGIVIKLHGFNILPNIIFDRVFNFYKET